MMLYEILVVLVIVRGSHSVCMDEIKANYSHYETLSRISLRGCDLKEMPPELTLPEYNLPNMEELDLRDNNIRSITDGFFRRFASLKRINLSNNPGLILTEETFSGMEYKLTQLSLQKLGITSIGSIISKLSDLNYITVIDLSYNKITSLGPEDDTQIDGYSTINLAIDLTGNQISDISNDFIRRLTNENFAQVTLFLAGNKLKNLNFLNPPCDFRNLEIRLDAEITPYDPNPFFCDCNLYNITRFNAIKIDGGYCQGPEAYTGLQLGFWTPRDDLAYPEGGAHYFMKEARSQCDDITKEVSRYNCDCGTWVSYTADEEYSLKCSMGAINLPCWMYMLLGALAASVAFI
ncbi:unnamed protein product [Owenia fusiformis]|uniref:Uncharacterized protein n=1 Tax=Owenia fusiformis TaxID=6347 RepID=A0A8J1TY81_OWEFU|nr:unnamed protein product [Owenia fusiformis]